MDKLCILCGKHRPAKGWTVCLICTAIVYHENRTQIGSKGWLSAVLYWIKRKTPDLVG